MRTQEPPRHEFDSCTSARRDRRRRLRRPVGDARAGAAPVRITLVDRRNHHLFQPLLYQVATAGLSAPDIAAPLRHILREQRNVEVRLGEVDRHRRRQRSR